MDVRGPPDTSFDQLQYLNSQVNCSFEEDNQTEVRVQQELLESITIENQ